MKVINTNIEGVYVFEPTVFNDSRGFFLESFNKQSFLELNLENEFVQDNHSKSTYGVIRGLHFQKEPYAQAKLVRVVKGEILDVCVDLRKNSPTFGKYFSVRLSEKNNLQLYIPRNFAHGFSVLSETAEVLYKCDNYYNKTSESGIIYNDKTLNINWEVDENKAIISEKDLSNKTFSELKNEINK